MKHNLLRRKSSLLLIAAVLFFGFIFSSNPANSQLPKVPILSLTGAGNGWNDNWYPDGRIRVPASPVDSPRELLVPVFINNRWKTFDENPDYVCNPIRSFKFSLQYDSSAMRPIGIQKFGPNDDDLGYEPLAKNFNISWDDDRDESYWEYLNSDKPSEDKKRGRTLTITGSSTTPLPNTNLYSDEYKVLLYVKFRIIPRSDQFTGAAGKTPLYVSPDTIQYNGVNIREENPFKHGMGHYSDDVYLDDFTPTQTTGVAGIYNYGTLIWPTEPTLFGTIYVIISEYLPKFNFDMSRGWGQTPAIDELSPYLFDVLDPLTIHTGSMDPFVAKRELLVTNSIPQTRLQDITIKTDQPWLLFDIKKGNRISPPVRNIWINWLDNGLLGNEGLSPLGDPTQDDGDLYLTIRCDPSQLDNTAEDPHGIHVGYITFSSNYAEISPVRVRVTFIYFNIPSEPELYDAQGDHGGILLTIRNSRNEDDGGYQETSMIFGVGNKASDGVDTLYGEYPHISAMDGFGARFHPTEAMADEVKDHVPYGFGDFAPNDEEQMTGVKVDPQDPFNNDIVPGSGSRDIRNIDDTLTSLSYLVKFDAGSANNYPVTIEWNVNDFPDGATLFLRDVTNGQEFNINMREATPKGNGVYTYTLQDPRWDSFIIEYTLPRVVYYVDEYGNPLIKKGWNLLSLPVRSISTFWEDVYPNALNKPIDFFNSGFQEVEDLKVGKGYYVKYSDVVDMQFAGSYINRISTDIGDFVRLYPGWNTIGALSAPVGINQINFEEVPGMAMPDKELVIRHGIWGYKTARGFFEVTEMRPGLGYWINCIREDDASAHSYYELELPILPRMAVPYDNSDKQMTLNLADEIVVRDNGQSETSLYMTDDTKANVEYYQLPPLPPAGYFDARFSNGAILETSNATVLNLQGVQYPISLSIDNPSANYTFVDAITGEVLGTIEYGNNSNIEIKGTSGDAIKVLKSDIALPSFFISAYPNPVVANTTFEYAIPQNGFVNISLFDAIGNHISTLVRENKDAGTYSIDFDASGLSSGTYIIKLSSGDNNTVQTITVVK